MDKEARYAENNAKFIRYALIMISNNMEKVIQEFDYDSQCFTDKPGIYLFSAHFGPGMTYPVYIGKTEQGFKTRIREHHSDGGVIWMYKNGGFPTFPRRDFKLRILLLEIETAYIIKLAESLFLSSFDFALNKRENRERRMCISGITPLSEQESYDKFFNPVQERMMKDCARLRVNLC